MKRFLIIGIMVSICFTNSNFVFAVTLGWVNLQHRVYENEEDNHNRVSFGLIDDQGNAIQENIISDIQLFDPEGTEITFLETGGEKIIFWDNYSNISGQYNCNDSAWGYAPEFSNETYYVAKFLADLKDVGTYQLRIVLDSSEIITENIVMETEIIDIPVVSSKSFFIRKDEQENVILTWHVPDELYSLPASSARAFLLIYNDEEFMASELIVKVPTHMGYLFIPAATFEVFQNKLAELGNQMKIGVHIRTNNNHNRSYSNFIPYQDAETPTIDANGDGRTGLEEAILTRQINTPTFLKSVLQCGYGKARRKKAFDRCSAGDSSYRDSVERSREKIQGYIQDSQCSSYDNMPMVQDLFERRIRISSYQKTRKTGRQLSNPR